MRMRVTLGCYLNLQGNNNKFFPPKGGGRKISFYLCANLNGLKKKEKKVFHQISIGFRYALPWSNLPKKEMVSLYLWHLIRNTKGLRTINKIAMDLGSFCPLDVLNKVVFFRAHYNLSTWKYHKKDKKNNNGTLNKHFSIWFLVSRETRREWILKNKHDDSSFWKCKWWSRRIWKRQKEIFLPPPFGGKNLLLFPCKLR